MVKRDPNTSPKSVSNHVRNTRISRWKICLENFNRETDYCSQNTVATAAHLICRTDEK